MKRTLKEAILKSKKTQKEVAKQTGISEQYLSDMLNGKREINYKTVYKIGEFLNIDLDLVYSYYKQKKIEKEMSEVKNDYTL